MSGSQAIYDIVFPVNSIAGTRSNTVVYNPPLGPINVPWTPVNGDYNAANYSLNSDLVTVTWSPIPQSAPPNITPVMTIGPAGGTGGSVLIIGDNLAARLQVIVGTAPTTGVLFTVSFYNPQNLSLANYHPSLTPANNLAASVMQVNQIFVEIANVTNGFTVNVGTGKLTKGDVYIWNAMCSFT